MVKMLQSDLHDGFRTYAGLTPKQYLTDKHASMFWRSLEEVRPGIPVDYGDFLLGFIKNHVQWETFEQRHVRLDDIDGNNPSVIFTT